MCITYNERKDFMETTVRREGLPEPTTTIEHEITRAVDFYRGLLMDFLEMKYGEASDWQHTRSQVLKIMGTRGLEHKMREIVTKK